METNFPLLTTIVHHIVSSVLAEPQNSVGSLVEMDREVLVVDRLHARWDGTRYSWIGYRWGGGVGVKSGENFAEMGRVAIAVSETGKSAVGGPDGSKVGVTGSTSALSAGGSWRV